MLNKMSIVIVMSILALGGCGRDDTSTEPGDTHTIYMLGRSVMEGWFEHWGWDSDDNHPVVHGRFTLYHRTVEPPDGDPETMVNSVREIVDNIPSGQGAEVFFKLCFADFVGSSQSEAQANLTRNQGIVEGVYDIVVDENGHRLIVGNALPVPSNWIDEYIVWNQTQYNQWLLNLQSQHSGTVFVFDLYGILAGPTGAVRDEYTDGEPDDAHLNTAGYNALDDQFFGFVEGEF